MDLPFKNTKGGNKNSFYLLKENDFNKKTINDFIKKMLGNENIINDTVYIKGSDTKDYYKKK